MLSQLYLSHGKTVTFEILWYISSAFGQIIKSSEILKEKYKATQEERKRRTNIYNDDSGTHRKCTHYSSKNQPMLVN